jgi:hypothetical protein
VIFPCTDCTGGCARRSCPELHLPARRDLFRQGRAGRTGILCRIRREVLLAQKRKMPGFPTHIVGTPTIRRKARRYEGSRGNKDRSTSGTEGRSQRSARMRRLAHLRHSKTLYPCLYFLAQSSISANLSRRALKSAPQKTERQHQQVRSSMSPWERSFLLTDGF